MKNPTRWALPPTLRGHEARVCLPYLYYDFHAFPKVATLPDTEPIASQARDIKMHQGWGISDPIFEINTELFTFFGISCT